jgi:hypothetical protein
MARLVSSGRTTDRSSGVMDGTLGLGFIGIGIGDHDDVMICTLCILERKSK